MAEEYAFINDQERLVAVVNEIAAQTDAKVAHSMVNSNRAYILKTLRLLPGQMPQGVPTGRCDDSVD